MCSIGKSSELKNGDLYPTPRKHLTELQKLNKNYKIMRVVGSGQYGYVCSGSMDTSAGKVAVAVKIIDLEKTSKQYRTKFLPNEINALKNLRHPYIVRVHDTTQIENTVYVFMERAFGGDIINMLEEKQFKDGIPEIRTRGLYKMIASALRYIHSQGLAHRDIKSENILLMNKERTIAKLTDFGISTNCVLRSTKMKVLKKTYCGTPAYTAPEVGRHQPYDATIADVWSSGIVLFIMLNHEMPFTLRQVSRLSIDPEQPIKLEFSNKSLSEECKDLIHKQLEVDPEKRISMSRVLRHKWFSLT